METTGARLASFLPLATLAVPLLQALEQYASQKERSAKSFAQRLDFSDRFSGHDAAWHGTTLYRNNTSDD